MTLDRSLKVSGGLAGKRSVLTRAERIKILTDEDRFDPEKNCPLGLPKVRVKHSKAGSKSKKEEKVEEGAEGAEGAAAPAAAAAPAKEAKEAKGKGKK